MKKRGIKTLILNKKSVSNLQKTGAVKGGGRTDLCTGLAGSCWCDVTVTDCNCPRR
jgi:hypothetical protein